MGKKYTADTFEGAVTGTASGNVAKTGDTMTGNLTISKSNAILTVFDSDTSGSVPAIKMQARTVMSSSIPVYLTSDENQDFAIRKSSINSTSYADTSVGTLSSITNSTSPNNLEIQNNSTSWYGGTSNPMSKIRMFKADSYPNASGQEASLELYNVIGFGNNTKRGKLVIKTGDVEHIEVKNIPSDLGGSSFTYLKTPTTFTYAIQANNGIKLGGTASANELDDFEEGTANLEFGLASYSPGSSITYYGSGDFNGWINNSKYVKIGSSVTVYIDIKFSNASTQPSGWLSSMATTWLGGLPFSVAGSYTSDYSATSPLHGDYAFGLNMQNPSTDNGYQIRPYKWGTYGMYFGFTRTSSATTPLYNNAFNYPIGSSNYGARQITGVIHYRTTQ
jgi:hypothetical protein